MQCNEYGTQCQPKCTNEQNETNKTERKKKYDLLPSSSEISYQLHIIHTCKRHLSTTQLPYNYFVCIDITHISSVFFFIFILCRFSFVTFLFCLWPRNAYDKNIASNAQRPCTATKLFFPKNPMFMAIIRQRKKKSLFISNI